MELAIHHYRVDSVEFKAPTAFSAGCLQVDPDELRQYLQSRPELAGFRVGEMAWARPGEPVRVVNIFDVVPAYFRLGADAVQYPGAISPIRPVGQGTSAFIENLDVLVLNRRPNRNNKLLDLSGPGTQWTPQAERFHLAVDLEPVDPQVPEGVYWGALKRLGLLTGTYLARAASQAVAQTTAYYRLDAVSPQLPRVAYVFMLASHQRPEPGQPVLYGDDVSGLLPTLLHPNEVLDGAVVSPYWNLGVDMWSYQRNPVVLELYARHGVDLAFAGVVATVAHATRPARQRSVTMAAHLVRYHLGADAAVVTKVGGGIPESDVMMTLEALEELNVRASGLIWSHLGEGGVEDSLTAYSPRADALVSAGIFDDWVDLPAMPRVIGGEQAGPFSDDANELPKPASGPLRVQFRHISGAINQLGGSRVSQVAY